MSDSPTIVTVKPAPKRAAPKKQSKPAPKPALKPVVVAAPPAAAPPAPIAQVEIPEIAPQRPIAVAAPPAVELPHEHVPHSLPMMPTYEIPGAAENKKRPYAIPVESKPGAMYSNDSVLFYSRYNSLKLQIVEKRLNKETGFFERYEIPVSFPNGVYPCDEPGVAELLRKEGGYGGSKANDFNDRTSSFQPVFWEGGLPDWFLQEQAEEAADVKYVAGQNEVGHPLDSL